MTPLETSVVRVVLSIQTVSNAKKVTFVQNATLPLEHTSILKQTNANPAFTPAKPVSKNTRAHNALNPGWLSPTKPKDNALTAAKFTQLVLAVKRISILQPTYQPSSVPNAKQAISYNLTLPTLTIIKLAHHVLAFTLTPIPVHQQDALLVKTNANYVQPSTNVILVLMFMASVGTMESCIAMITGETKR